MIESEKIEFTKIMTMCYNIIGVAPDVGTIDAYWTVINDYDLQDVQQAFTKSIKNLKTRTLPMPGEIKDFIEGKDEDKIDFAFEDAKAMIRKLGMYRDVKMINPISMQIIRDYGGLLKWDEAVFANKPDLYFEWKRKYKNYLDKMKRGEWMPEERPLCGYGSSYDASGKYSIPELWGYTEEQKQIEQKKYLKL